MNPFGIRLPTLVAVPLVAMLLTWLFAPGALAQPSTPGRAGIDWLQLNMGLFGGLALFLAGLEVLSEGLKKAAGNTLRDVLQRLTVNRFMGALTGAFVTGVMNSSSVTTVLVVGFVTAGVMSLSQSVGVIMGANIGSTLTAQILAFNVAAYSLVPVAVGFFMFFAGKRERMRHVGMMIMGLGLVFYGMGLMSDGMKPLRSYEPFLEILARMENPLLGIVAGAAFTGLVQSSAATVGIAIAMASEGLLSLPAGIALALGANIGTCVTALLAALGKPTEAVRAAVVHIAFNILGVLIWLPFLSLLAHAAVAVSPVAAGLEGQAQAAAEVPRQIANANTLFNVANTLLFIAFTGWFSRLAERLVPERAAPQGTIIAPAFLDQEALAVPAVALENVRREIGRAGRITGELMDDLRTALEQRDRSGLDESARRRNEVTLLGTAIIGYLGHVRQGLLTEEEGATHQGLMLALTHLDSVTEVAHSDIAALARAFLEGEYEAASIETQDLVRGLWEGVREAVSLSVRAVDQADQRAAEDVLLMKEHISELADRLFERHAQRLRGDDPRYLDRVRILMAFVEQLRHIYTLTRRIARSQLPPELARDAS